MVRSDWYGFTVNSLCIYHHAPALGRYTAVQLIPHLLARSSAHYKSGWKTATSPFFIYHFENLHLAVLANLLTCLHDHIPYYLVYNVNALPIQDLAEELMPII